MLTFNSLHLPRLLIQNNYSTLQQAAPAAQRPVAYVPVANTKDNPPCNTLFIGNLSEACDEGELRALFAGQPGFRQLKLVRACSGSAFSGLQWRLEGAQ